MADEKPFTAVAGGRIMASSFSIIIVKIKPRRVPPRTTPLSAARVGDGQGVLRLFCSAALARASS
jgi:hypothetical protein